MTKFLKAKFYGNEKLTLVKLNGDVKLGYGDSIVVRTDKGRELVKVLSVLPYNEESLSKLGVKVESLPSFMRKSSEDDRKKFIDNENFCKSAVSTCRKKAKDLNLSMKIIKAYATLEREQITFFFTAESRVDFRQLVRNLAAHFKTRIELRQIGVRDEVKLIGGIGICGRPCCCKAYMECFDSVSLNLARSQGLIPNPAKLSGTCGRLMCCLKFEEANYYIRKFLPNIGEEVVMPEGKGRITDINVPLEEVTLEFPGGKKKFHISKLTGMDKWNEYIEMLKEKHNDELKCFIGPARNTT